MSTVPTILIIVATQGEAARLHSLDGVGGYQVKAAVSGVGSVAAALATQQAVSSSAQKPRLIISAGIGGAFESSGLQPGDVAAASQMVQADLGAWDGPQWLRLQTLGLEVAPEQYGAFTAWEGSKQLGLPCGPFITVNSVTGSRAGADELLRRVPGAFIEGMEGAGVAHAAHLAGIPVTEVRGVSNFVGPRNRSAWRILEALAGLEKGLRLLLESGLA